MQVRRALSVAVFAGLLAFGMLRPSQASACGGFFCGRQPVDQTAERIIFRVNQDTTTMVVQISYQGTADEFAWVLPLGEVPAVDSLAVFPQRALTALDANTGPQFIEPSECLRFVAEAAADGAASGDSTTGAGSSVTVHFRAEVGPYDVAAIESQDSMALYDWLIKNGFNVGESMKPYIAAYTDEGMKFLALKLLKEKDVTDIQPFRFDLPGTIPSIPLRMTALAAEPEMGLLVFLLGDQRYAGQNWPAIDIPDDRIVWRQYTWPMQTNWTALVAKGVDEAGGQGWVTELAGSTQPILTALDNSFFSSAEDEQAAMELRELIGDASYVTRLYSRLSAEEMTSDPVFRRDEGGDVDNLHQLSRYVDGEDLCPDVPVSPDPCLFTSCGAGGICRPVMLDGATEPVGGCGCVPGASARTTLDPVSAAAVSAGVTPGATAICLDARMSFVNPGDEMASGETMGDPCEGYDCGAGGECVAVNMTPTCTCDRGKVAVGRFDPDGSRVTRCEEPMMPVPEAFYAQRLPELPLDLPGGREVEVDPELPVVTPSMDDMGSDSMPVPDTTDPGTDSSGGSGLITTPPKGAGDGAAGSLGGAAGSGSPNGSSDGGLCSVRAPGAGGRGIGAAGGLLLGFALMLRRRRRRRG